MTTRLLRQELLFHPLREAIFDAIQTEPGIPFLGLFHRLKPVPEFSSRLGYGSLSYHLQLLEHFGYVTSRKAGRCRRYYENGGPQSGHTSELALLQTDPVSQLARLVVAHPGASQQELWHRFEQERPCTRQAVGYQLGRMRQNGLVAVGRRGRWKAYVGTEKLATLLELLPTACPQNMPMAPVQIVQEVPPVRL